MKKLFSKESTKSKAQYAQQNDPGTTHRDEVQETSSQYQHARQQHLEAKLEERRARQSNHLSKETKKVRYDVTGSPVNYRSVSDDTAPRESAVPNTSYYIDRQTLKRSIASKVVNSEDNLENEEDYDTSLPVGKPNGLQQQGPEEQIAVPVEKQSIFSKDDRIIAIVGGSAPGRFSFISSLDMGFSRPSRIGYGTAKMAGRDNIVALSCPGLDDEDMYLSDILNAMAEWLADAYRVEARFYGFIFLVSHSPSLVEKKTTRFLREICGPSDYQNATQFLVTSPKQPQRFYEPTNVTELWESMAVADTATIRCEETTVKSIAARLSTYFTTRSFCTLWFQTELLSLNPGNTAAGQFLQFCVLRDEYRYNQEYTKILSVGDPKLIAQATRKLETQNSRCAEETRRLKTNMSRLIEVLAMDRTRYENENAKLKSQLIVERQESWQLANDNKVLQQLFSGLEADLKAERGRHQILDEENTALKVNFAELKAKFEAEQEDCRALAEENEALRRQKIQIEMKHQEELEAIKSGNYDSRPILVLGPPLPPRIPGLGRKIQEEILAREKQTKGA